MTTHRLPTPLAPRAQTVAAAVLLAALLVQGPGVRAAIGYVLVAAGLTLGALLVQHVAIPAAHRRTAARYHDGPWPPEPHRPSGALVTMTVQDRDHAEALDTASGQEFHQQLEGSGQPRPYVPAEQSVLESVVEPLRGRWMTLQQMRPDDDFLLGEVVLHLVRVDHVTELEGTRLALVRVRDMPIPLTLPVDQRWLMYRAVRTAAVRCLICSEQSSPLAEIHYDLATDRAPAVVAVCPSCEDSTSADPS